MALTTEQQARVENYRAKLRAHPGIIGKAKLEHPVKQYLEESEDFVYKALQKAFINNNLKSVGVTKIFAIVQYMGRGPARPTGSAYQVGDFEDCVKRTLNRLVKKGRVEAISETKTFQHYGPSIKRVSKTELLYYGRPSTTPIGTYQQVITKYSPL